MRINTLSSFIHHGGIQQYMYYDLLWHSCDQLSRQKQTSDLTCTVVFSELSQTLFSQKTIVCIIVPCREITINYYLRIFTGNRWAADLFVIYDVNYDVYFKNCGIVCTLIRNSRILLISDNIILLVNLIRTSINIQVNHLNGNCIVPSVKVQINLKNKLKIKHCCPICLWNKWQYEKQIPHCQNSSTI